MAEPVLCVTRCDRGNAIGMGKEGGKEGWGGGKEKNRDCEGEEMGS